MKTLTSTITDVAEAGQPAAGNNPVAEPDVSIVIPCYRDENSLPKMIERLENVMDTIPGTSELVLVDDGSPDRTGVVALELSKTCRHPVAVVRLARNFGQHAAVFAGFAESRGKVIITMDSDLQYPPEQVNLLLENLSEEYPVVSGYRKDRNDPWARKVITGTLSRWLSRRTGQQLTDYGSMFRAYDRVVIDQMLRFTEQHRFIPALVAWLGYPVREIPVEHHSRSEQGSRYRLTPLIEMFLDLITSYSVSPLRFFTVGACVASLTAFAATCSLAMYRIAFGDGPTGTVSAFALVFLLLAVQLMVMAMLGEYVGRIYVEAKGRPYFIVGSVDRTKGKSQA